MHQISEEIQTLRSVFNDIKTVKEKIAFAENNIFVDKKNLLLALNEIKDENKKIDFIYEAIEDLDLKSTTIIQKDRKNSITNEFVITFLDNFDRVVTDYKITNAEMRVILYMLKKMEFGNLLILKQTAVCESLKMKKANVSMIFKKLKEKNILIEDEEKNLYINSNIFMKGLPHKLKKEKLKDLKNSQVENEKITKSY